MTYEDYVAWAWRTVHAALEPVRDARRAVAVEYDEGRVICRCCLGVMATDESNGWREGWPLCVGCVLMEIEDRGGEA